MLFIGGNPVSLVKGELSPDFPGRRKVGGVSESHRVAWASATKPGRQRTWKQKLQLPRQKATKVFTTEGWKHCTMFVEGNQDVYLCFLPLYSLRNVEET